MALHDYACPCCHHIERDVNVSIEIGAQAGAPYCPQHTDPPTVMEWIPKVGRMDAYEPFQEFVTQDCYGRQVTVESMRKLRQLEEESQREYANGPRDAVGNPVAQMQIWRDYSQDKSNRDVHTFAKQLDRPMDMQQDRLEAKGKKHNTDEGGMEQVHKGDVPFSAGDVLGE